MRQILRILAVAMAALAIISVASAQTAIPETPTGEDTIIEIPEGTGVLRVGHFSPDAGAVDVFVAGEIFIAGLEFGQVTEYMVAEDLPAEFQFAVAPVGKGIEAAVVGPNELSIADQQGTLLMVVGSVANNTLSAVPLQEDLSDPGEGIARINYLHLLESTASLLIAMNDEVLNGGTPIVYGNFVPTIANALTYTIQIMEGGAPENIVFDLPGTVIEPRTYYIVVMSGTETVPQIFIYGIDLTTLDTVAIESEGIISLLPGTTDDDEAANTMEPEASAEPNFGEIDLEAGFTPDPFSRDVETGNEINIFTMSLGEDCVGTVAIFRTGVIHWSGDSELLRLFVVSEDDSTLIIELPDGEYVCNNNASGKNPQIDIVNPEEGTYTFWVGSYAPGIIIGATVYVTELETVDATTVSE